MTDFPLKPRVWQEEFLATALHHLRQPNQKNFLAAVCPGAGKTMAALMLAHRLEQSEQTGQIIVVVHTDHLRDQWLEEAESVNIPFKIELSTDPVNWGVVVTYQQLLQPANQDAIRTIANWRKKALVVFDEIHHAGDGKEWAKAVKVTFKNAGYRLLLTGTPFRNDNRPIPYVSYDKTGRLVAQFAYSYEDALRDGYVAPAHFYTFDLDGRWKRGDHELAVGFGDYLGQQDATDRLNTAIGSTAWRKALIGDGFEKLKALRSDGDTGAAMLIVARDIAHAYQIERETKKLTGEIPVTVTSDDSESSRKIAAFRDGKQSIIIAVRMISEGVDIPRLRVGVYLTNVRTDLFFWQWVGRYIRVPEGTNPIDKLAHLYMPAERSLVEYATTIKDQRVQVLEPEAKIEAARANGKGESMPPLKVIEAAAIAGEDFRVSDPAQDISQDEINAALAVMAAYKITDRTVAQVVGRLRALAGTLAPVT